MLTSVNTAKEKCCKARSINAEHVQQFVVAAKVKKKKKKRTIYPNPNFVLILVLQRQSEGVRELMHAFETELRVRGVKQTNKGRIDGGFRRQSFDAANHARLRLLEEAFVTER